jgi:Enoyl-(Acyl carrier protein) reductase
LRPEEIVAVVAFLCSADASAIAGAAIVIDGGLTEALNLSGHAPYEGSSLVARRWSLVGAAGLSTND